MSQVYCSIQIEPLQSTSFPVSCLLLHDHIDNVPHSEALLGSAYESRLALSSFQICHTPAVIHVSNLIKVLEHKKLDRPTRMSQIFLGLWYTIGNFYQVRSV